MTVDEIRAARNADPFRPFAVVLSDGRRLKVVEPLAVAVHPQSRTVIVNAPDGLHPVDIQSIDKLDFSTGRRAPRKHANGARPVRPKPEKQPENKRGRRRPD